MERKYKDSLRIGALTAAILLACTFIFGLIAYKDWTQEKTIDTNHVLPTHDVGNLLHEGRIAEQTVSFGFEYLDSITVWPRVAGTPQGEMQLDILQQGEVLGTYTADIGAMQDYTPYTIEGIDLAIDAQQPVLLRFSAIGELGEEDHFSVFYGDSVAVSGRYEIAVQDIADLYVNGETVSGKISMDVIGHSVHEEIMIYYSICAALLVLLGGVGVGRLAYLDAAGRENTILKVVKEVQQYSYLTSRLVSRNFNTKYRQSVLGVLWSVLNPIFTMLVLYVVFSTLFKTDTENYIVYLLSGIIAWNFFTEAVNLGLESITGNASIINKVYVPRYIYPISNVFSALINFLIAHIPLILLCLITGLSITPAFLLVPIAIIYLFLFACGIALLMATSNVFFRDTRFLWSIITMMWMYLTPLFYTESIIAEAYINIYRANPMYQFIYIFRSLIIQGVVPQPQYFINGFFAAVIPLAIGIWVFNRNQNRFVLYL